MRKAQALTGTFCSSSGAGSPILDAVPAASFQFLGTATSVGIPVIGCDCAVCRSDDSRDKRTRASALVRFGELTILIDSGPDLREQALREGLRKIDAVIYTHAHLDHVAGFDELRAFCWRRDEPLPLFAGPGCMDALETMYGWAFSEENTHRGYVKPAARRIAGPFEIGALTIVPLPVVHANIETHGFLFRARGMRSIAYIPDVKEIPAATRALIQGVDVLALDALRPTPHPTHFSVSDALTEARLSGASEIWLTHLGHEQSHAELEAKLPPGHFVASDGVCIELEILA